MKLSRIALRNIRRNLRRSLLSATATAIATLAIVVLFSLIAGIKDNMQHNVSTLVSGNVRIRSAEYDKNEYLNPLQFRIENPEPLFQELSKNAAVVHAVERIPFGTGIYRNEDTTPVQGLGVDFERERTFMGIGNLLLKGKLPQAGKNEAVVGPILARELGVNVGDTITLLATTMRRATNAITFTITGIVGFPIGSMNGTLVLVPLDRAQRLLRMGNAVTEILLILRDPQASSGFAKSVTASMHASGRPDLHAMSWLQINTLLSFMDLAEAIYAIIGLFFFILASTVLVNTTMMVIHERTREIGTIGAMGMTGPEIVRLFFLESLALAIIGAVAGMILGAGLSTVLANTGIDMTEALQGIDFSVSNVVYPRLNLPTTILVGLYSVTIASAAAILPARRAAYIEPVEALRTV